MLLDAANTVVGVAPGSQAALGGVRLGDVVVALDGAPCTIAGATTTAAASAFGAHIAVGATVAVGLRAAEPAARAAAAGGGGGGVGLQLTGTLHKRSATSGMYKKVKVALEGGTLIYADFKSDRSAVLRGADVERLEVANREKLEFVLLSKKDTPERGRTHGFRVSTRAEFGPPSPEPEPEP